METLKRDHFKGKSSSNQHFSRHMLLFSGEYVSNFFACNKQLNPTLNPHLQPLIEEGERNISGRLLVGWEIGII